MSNNDKMPVIDLKPVLLRGHPAWGYNISRQEPLHVYWQTGFLSGYRSSSLAQLSSVRQALSGESQGQVLHMSRPVSLHGLCPIDLSGKSARYRSLSAGPEQQALSHGHSQPGIEEHAGQLRDWRIYAVLSHTSAKHKQEMGEGLKRIFSSDNGKEARQKFNELAAQMENKAAKAIDCLERGLEDALAVLALPSKYRRRLKSTNMQERLIQEIRRRERVIRIFPNEESALRLMGALLAEIHEEWQGRRYLDMDVFHEWAAEQSNAPDETIVQIR